MNIRNYMKRENLCPEACSTEELTAKFVNFKISKKHLLIGFLVLLLPAFFAVKFLMQSDSLPNNDIFISLADTDLAAASQKKDVISIPSGMVKANPFLPYRNIGDEPVMSDVPMYDLVEPPEVIDEGSDAARIMDTIVSGILYDKFSPSAILNIEGNDYLVKKGDVINNYKIVDIMKDSVTVKLGSNTYKAGIGEILTEGTVNHNDVSNLNKKFGGEKR